MPLHTDCCISKLTLKYLLLSSISFASSPPDETTDTRTANQILPFQEESVARNDLHLQTSAEFYGEASQLKYLLT